MSLGQTMITLAMLILLIMTVISAQRIVTENIDAQLGSEAIAYSSRIANDLFAEIGIKPFDRGAKSTSTSEIDTVYIDASHYVIDTLWAQDSTGTILSSSFTAQSDSSAGGAWGVSPVTKRMQTKWDLSAHPAGSVPSLSLPDVNVYTDVFYDKGTSRTIKNSSQYKSRSALRDVDDYDGYVRRVSTPDSLHFTARVRVYYVVSTSPDVQSSSNQYLKRIAVTVSLSDSTYFSPATYTAVVSY